MAHHGTTPQQSASSAREVSTTCDPPVAKRKRTALACNVCRTRKSRCNGARPRCLQCDSLGFACVYETSNSSINVIVQKDYLVGLAERLQALEEKVARHEQALARDSKSAANSEGPLAWRIRDPQATFQISPETVPPFEATFSPLHDAGLQELVPEERLPDGMAIVFTEEKDSGFFGPSSNIAFMKRILRVASGISAPESLPRLEDSDGPSPLDTGIVSATRPPSPFPTAHECSISPKNSFKLHALPTVEQTRTLIANYFANTGLLFPYIHETSFLAQYDQFVAADFKNARRTWLGLLYMILAMSSSISITSCEEDRQKSRVESFNYYDTAMNFCGRQTLRGTNLETVQLLLLMSQYLQGTQFSAQTWMIHGATVKSAMSLGLHSSDASQNLAPLDREMRKRVWYGCVMLDRILSMTFGRPGAIPSAYIRLPLPDPISDAPGGENSAHELLSVEFFRFSISMYQILDETLANLYDHNLSFDQASNEVDILDRISLLDRSLSRWELDLPSDLALCSGEDLSQNQCANPVHERFRIILTLRKLNLQVLIHRPALMRSVDSFKHNRSQVQASRSIEQLRQNSLQSCVESAQEIIQIIHHVTAASEGAKKHLLGAWWFSLYYVFNSAFIIFGYYLLILQSGTDRIMTADRCHGLILKSREALAYLDTDNLVITRCKAHLSQLLRFINTRATEYAESSTARSRQGAYDLNSSLQAQFPDISMDCLDVSSNFVDEDPLELNQFCLPNGFSTSRMPGV